MDKLRPTNEELTKTAELFREDEPQRQQILSLRTDKIMTAEGHVCKE